jgi:hypothetical protein
MWRHRKTNGLYVVVGGGRLESEWVASVSYMALNGDSTIIHRAATEFMDGRFEHVPNHVIQKAMEADAEGDAKETVLPSGEWEPIPCPCGHSACRDWMIRPVAAVQGVSFTKEEAIAVCEAHNRGLI